MFLLYPKRIYSRYTGRVGIIPITEIRCSSFITSCLGSIGIDPVISDFVFLSEILQKNYKKMTMLWSFSCNSFVKFMVYGSHNITVLYPNLCKIEACYKGNVLYFLSY